MRRVPAKSLNVNPERLEIAINPESPLGLAPSLLAVAPPSTDDLLKLTQDLAASLSMAPAKKRAMRPYVKMDLDGVMQKLKSARAVYLSFARAHAHSIAKASPTRTVTIDDVRSLCPPPEGVDPRIMGAVFLERGVWEFVNFERSVRAACHHRPIQRFRLLA